MKWNYFNLEKNIPISNLAEIMPNLIKQFKIGLNSIIVFGLFFDLYSPDISLDQNKRPEMA